MLYQKKKLVICFDGCKNPCYTNCDKFFLKRTMSCTLKFFIVKKWFILKSFSKPMQLFSSLPQRGCVKTCITLETHSITRGPNHGTSPYYLHNEIGSCLKQLDLKLTWTLVFCFHLENISTVTPTPCYPILSRGMR